MGENPFQITAANRADARSALDEVQTWRRPLPEARLLGLLGELYLRTLRRMEGENEQRAMFSLYARELAKYPGDVVFDKITNYRGKFFPALDELREPIEKDERIRQRRLISEALAAFLDGRSNEPPRGKRPTTEQIQRNAEAFGIDRRKLSPEAIARIAAVDRVHGDRALPKRGTFAKARAARS